MHPRINRRNMVGASLVVILAGCGSTVQVAERPPAAPNVSSANSEPPAAPATAAPIPPPTTTTTVDPTSTQPVKFTYYAIAAYDALPALHVELPTGYVTTPLAHRTQRPGDGAAGLTYSTQSFGLAPKFDQSVIVTVSGGSPADAQLHLNNSTTTVATITGSRKEDIYTWIDSDTGQRAAAFETWSAGHRPTPPLSDYAVSRESMYEGHDH